jgi:uncharacterized delta-60 repeat protein
MKKKSSSQSAFFNVRVLIRLFIILVGIFLALLALGGFFNVFAQPKISTRDSAGVFSVPTFSAQGSYDVSRFSLPTTDGGSALDGFDPNANGPVYVVVVQPDGKILIGGGFTSVLGVTRNRIARLNPDGTLDTTFDPNVTNANLEGPPPPQLVVISIALQADGKILVGGFFTSIGGQPRNNIARLDPVTGLADSWDPNATGSEQAFPVQSIVVQADGKILVGGDFDSIGGQTRNNIARLDATTGLADSFDPNATGDPFGSVVYSIVLQADGKILTGGAFASIGGQPRNNIARLDPTTGLADSLDPNATGGGGGYTRVHSIAVPADGKILAGGHFTLIGGQPRNNIARLDPITGLADSFNPDAPGLNIYVHSIVVQPDGKILAGGEFTSIGGQIRNRIARLDATTGSADSFDPNANDLVRSIAVQPDGKILAGGFFTTLSPNGGAAVTRNRTARLETDGRLDQTLNLSTVGSYVTATAVQADGRILIGGSFSTVLGVTRNNIARLNTDGTLDMAFNPNANDAVHSIAVQADGKILAGGFFNGANSIGGQSRNFIARLDPITGLADSFNPNASSTVYALAVQSDGNILAAGEFTSIGGHTRNHIARLDPTTSLADSFNPNANDRIYSITVQTDGKVLASGLFTSIGGLTRNHIARLNPDGTLDAAFDPNANGNVHSFAVQTDGKIVAGGLFSSIGGQPRNNIARLDGTTGLADSWSLDANERIYSIAVQADGKIVVGGVFTSIGGQTRNHIARLGATGVDSFDPNANGNVQSIAVQADGKILAGGMFSSIGGQTRSLFARLTNDTAALQNLTVTQTTITWTLGGSSLQFTRVIFAYSADNVTYTSLGNGTATGNSWILTGLNLPTGQNIYIRALGYYRGGFSNGSESTMESVRNAFLSGAPSPTPTPTATATATVTPRPIPLPRPRPTPLPRPTP